MSVTRALLFAFAMAVTHAAAAQWATGAGDGARSDARARAADGAGLRIHVDARGRLLATFTLASGLRRLDPRGCPTFQVDDKVPQDLSGEDHECTVDGPDARVVLARASDGEVRSETLVALMNGGNLTVRYRLEHAGYGASRFSLRGSKQALIAALEGIAIAGD